MPEFGPNMPDLRSTDETLAVIGLVFLVLGVLFTIALAVWLFRDAESRGKSGIAAALIALISAFYGMPLTVMVVCAWVLFRPERIRRGPVEESLPEQLPSGIQAAPSSEEFLEGLQEKSSSW